MVPFRCAVHTPAPEIRDEAADRSEATTARLAARPALSAYELGAGRQVPNPDVDRPTRYKRCSRRSRSAKLRARLIGESRRIVHLTLRLCLPAPPPRTRQPADRYRPH